MLSVMASSPEIPTGSSDNSRVNEASDSGSASEDEGSTQADLETVISAFHQILMV